VADRRPRSLRIRSVVAAQGPQAGEPVESAEPGTSIRVLGSGFGEKPAAVQAVFDDTAVPVFSTPFSDRQLTVTCPLVPEETSRLRIRVGRRTSSAVRFAVRPPKRRRRPPGQATRELFGVVDQYAALTAVLARALAPRVGASGALTIAADGLDEGRKVVQRNLELWLQWAPLQAKAPFEPLRTVALTDELVASGGLTARMRSLTAQTYGPGGTFDLSQEGKPEATELPASTLGDVGFILQEGAKLLEGVEDVLNTLAPSIEVGIGAGIEGSVDVQLSLGAPVSALGKLVDFVGQLVGKSGDDAGKADIERRLEGIEQTVGLISGRMIELLDAVALLEQKADRAEGKSDQAGQQLEGLVRKVDGLEAKGDRLEEKTERLEGKADRLEGKADRDGLTLDDLVRRAEAQEEKLDRLEEKDDRLEGKADTIHERLDLVIERQDRLEGKADRLEGKADSLEEKGDRLEGKVDRLEGKGDRVEGKVDQLEGKVDRIEVKGDRVEGKLDLLESKADAIEGKLDRAEAKLDRVSRELPHEASVADQRGTAGRVTGAVTALAADGQVYVRAAIDRRRDELDDEASWSPWAPFGAPGTAARTRDGGVFHRVYESQDHNGLADAAQWTAWLDFLRQP